MFGQNKVAKVNHREDGSLFVHSVFRTLQGEGPDAGRPAVFVRLSGCNLRCFFCDTDFDAGTPFSVEELAYRIERTSEGLCDLVVITGGEPLLQNINPLVYELNVRGMTVSVETAGTVFLDGLDQGFKSHTSQASAFRPHLQETANKIICSPKTPLLNLNLLPYIDALKYIVRAGEIDHEDGLPIKSTQKRGNDSRLFRPWGIIPLPRIYLQPLDEQDEEKNKRNLQAAAMACMSFGYNLSVQVHKLVGLP